MHSMTSSHKMKKALHRRHPSKAKRHCITDINYYHTKLMNTSNALYDFKSSDENKSRASQTSKQPQGLHLMTPSHQMQKEALHHKRQY